MGKRIELQIEDASTTLGYFHFTVEGDWIPSLEPIYNVGNPPVVAEIREVWNFTNLRIVTPDNTVPTMWTGPIADFRSAFEERIAHPTFVRLVHDPRGSAEVTLLTLGPAAYEGLRIDLIEGAQDSEVPDSSNSTTSTWNITVSAVKKLPHAVTGIVGFVQRVAVSYENGLRILEWITTITTKEGTDARTKAEVYARIPDAALGGDHAFETNGPNGIDFEYTDADESQESTPRIPTVVVAVSRIRQYGESVGATGSGTGANFFQTWTEVRKTADDEETITFARAEGPNGKQYVTGKRPAGTLSFSVEHDEPTKNIFWGQWEKKVSRADPETGSDERDEFKITLTPQAPVDSAAGPNRGRRGRGRRTARHRQRADCVRTQAEPDLLLAHEAHRG
jgi:hypothetical protein